MRPLSEVKTTLKQKGHRTLLISLLLMILASPFLSTNPMSNWLLAVILMLVLLAAARTVAGQGRQFQIALVLGTAALLSQFGVLGIQWAWLEITRYAATSLFLFWVCGLLLGDIILRSHKVTLDLLLGAVNVYLMIAVGFAFTYSLIEHLQPGAFTGLEELVNTSDRVLYFLYFSFITISTLGYGDISPLTQHGMTVAYVEAVFGQFYLAILVARLVAIYIEQTRATDQASKS